MIVFAERLMEMNEPSEFDAHIFVATVERIIVSRGQKKTEKLLPSGSETERR